MKHTFSLEKEHGMLMNTKWYPVPTTLSPCLPRSYDAGAASIPFLLRWYYVNPLLLRCH